MKPGHLFIAAALLLALPSCTKNTASKIPHIKVTYFGPADKNKPYLQPKDTAVIQFSLVDGDADLGTDNGSDIFIRDLRFESIPNQAYPFPVINREIEDPDKGLEGECLFFYPQPITPRQDSAHSKLDTVKLELYIMDRAGNKSNTEVTLPVLVKP